MKFRFFGNNDWKDGSIYFDIFNLSISKIGRENSKSFGVQIILVVLGLGFVLNIYRK